MSLFAVFPGELLCVFHELLSILKKLLGELSTQWMFRLGIIA
jgi:predicted DNA-binding ArsR family transcriptional regulator